jgi:hypothetical protein
MRRSEHHVLASHVGSLPRPDALIEANCAREAGEAPDATAFEQIFEAGGLGCRAASARARHRYPK